MLLRMMVLVLLFAMSLAGEEKAGDTKVSAPDAKIFYKGRWVTAEFKEKSEQGLVFYKNKWMSEDEMYQDKGYVKHLGTWISKSRLQRIKAGQQLARERIKNSSDWNNAWKHPTPQGHFIITSNVSPDLVQEIGTAMEQCYAELSKVFGLKKDVKNINVEVFATQKQFMDFSAKDGSPVGSNVGGYFYWGGTSMGIRSFYKGSTEQTLSTLFHECTHLVFKQVCENVPTWANEGFAVFFESAKRNEKGMDLETIPFDRLWSLKRMMERSELSLNHLCKLQGSREYTGEYYPQGWSLIYFLIYADNKKYFKNLDAFIANLKSKSYDGDGIELFKRSFGQEPDDLQPKWKEFVLSIEPKTTEELVAAARTAYSEYLDFNKAHEFATQALALMKKDDEQVLLCNARFYLTLGRWASEPEKKAEYYAKSIEFFQRVFPLDESGKTVVKSRKTTPAFARDRLDYARACIGAVEYERAQDLIEEVLSHKDFKFSGSGHSMVAYLAIMAKDSPFYSLELAKEYASLAGDLGADQENVYVKAQIALAEDRRADAIKLLNEAASRDEFGFGGLFFRREMARLTSESRR